MYTYQIFTTYTLNILQFYKVGKIINKQIVYSYNGVVFSIFNE